MSMVIKIPQKAENFFTNSTAIVFPMETLLHGVIKNSRYSSAKPKATYVLSLSSVVKFITIVVWLHGNQIKQHNESYSIYNR
jgi:hypothetical protein